MTEASSATTPVCYRHPSRETYVRCTRCDRPICPSCMNAASVGHQCPECIAEGRATQRAPKTAFGGSTIGRAGYATRTLIGLNCAVMVLALVTSKAPGNYLFNGLSPLGAHLAVFGQQGYTDGSSLPAGIASGEYYRLFTAMFTHLGLIHLAINMYSLWIIGRPLEAWLGPIRFLGLYLVSGLGGNVAAYVFAPTQHSAGASTAIFGLLGALFVVLRKLNLSPQQLLPVIVINLVFTFAIPNISIAGHIGGLITGAVVGLGLAYAPRERRTLIQSAVLVGVVALLAVATVVQTTHLNTLV